jgi:hypothetical protein
MKRYPGTELFISKRRYMAATRALYPPLPERRARHPWRVLRARNY